MKEQSRSNHTRWVPIFHFGLYPLIAFILAVTIINLNNAIKESSGVLMAITLLLIPICLILLALYSRSFALYAQDRAIRAEENLRHYVLTGKLLDSSLRTGQIVALRFAPDEEFVELARKATAEKLKGKEIKMLIKNWKADHHRV